LLRTWVRIHGRACSYLDLSGREPEELFQSAGSRMASPPLTQGRVMAFDLHTIRVPPFSVPLGAAPGAVAAVGGLGEGTVVWSLILDAFLGSQPSVGWQGTR